MAAHPEAKRLALWFADEARRGQIGRVTHVWHAKGERPRSRLQHERASVHLFGAVCPERDVGIALAPGTHAALVLDRAGWHLSDDLVVPANLTLLPLPPYSPELNPVERIWQHLRDRWLSHRVLAGGYAAVIEAACAAWNALRAETGRIRSLTSFPWLPKSVINS